MDQDGYLDHNEIQKACKDTGYSENYDEIRATLKDVSSSTAGKIDVEEFIEVKYCFLSFFFGACGSITNCAAPFFFIIPSGRIKEVGRAGCCDNRLLKINAAEPRKVFMPRFKKY